VTDSDIPTSLQPDTKRRRYQPRIGKFIRRALIERQCQQVHPQLDAGDGDDLAARINAPAVFFEPIGIPNDLVDATRA
jgi:hypothetical protein